MKKALRLDPTVAKQLQAPASHEAEVQRLLDNPQEITHFLDFRVDEALSQVEDNAHYHKYIVITSQTSRLFTKR